MIMVFGGTLMEVRVRAGDTLWHYSQLFFIPLVLIIDSNPSINPNALQLGEAIQIPGFTEDSYVIRSGDTIWKIAQMRNLNIDVLLLLNPKMNAKNLQVGQKIRLPMRVTQLIVNGKRPYDFQLMKTQLDQLSAIFPFMRRAEVGKSVRSPTLQCENRKK